MYEINSHKKASPLVIPRVFTYVVSMYCRRKKPNNVQKCPVAGKNHMAVIYNSLSYHNVQNPSWQLKPTHQTTLVTASSFHTQDSPSINVTEASQPRAATDGTMTRMFADDATIFSLQERTYKSLTKIRDSRSISSRDLWRKQ